MSETGLRKILQLCLAIERTAVETYSTFARQTEIQDYKVFWRDIALDEEGHLDYWQRLLALEGAGKLGSPFDDPRNSEDSFVKMLSRIEAMRVVRGDSFADTDAILFALRLESIMLHPAFFILFRGLKSETVCESPEAAYQQHIAKFCQFIDRFYNDKPELRLLVEIITDMCEHSLEMANQFDQIKTLRGLIPICPKCKSIRDDKGYWLQVESYLAEHGAAEFTHCLCPRCLQKLYPEFTSRK